MNAESTVIQTTLTSFTLAPITSIEELSRILSTARFTVTSRTPTTTLRRRNFEFTPGDKFRYFYFLYSNDLTQAHALEHSWYCTRQYNNCPWHYSW
jgi:hypothetical protein